MVEDPESLEALSETRSNPVNDFSFFAVAATRSLMLLEGTARSSQTISPESFQPNDELLLIKCRSSSVFLLYCFATLRSILLSGKSFFSRTTNCAGFSVNFSL